MQGVTWVQTLNIYSGWKLETSLIHQMNGQWNLEEQENEVYTLEEVADIWHDPSVQLTGNGFTSPPSGDDDGSCRNRKMI